MTNSIPCVHFEHNNLLKKSKNLLKLLKDHHVHRNWWNWGGLSTPNGPTTYIKTGWIRGTNHVHKNWLSNGLAQSLVFRA